MVTRLDVPLFLRVWGSPSHCATCDLDRPAVMVAAIPDAVRAGRWHVCGVCRAEAAKHKVALVYYDDVEASRAALADQFARRP